MRLEHGLNFHESTTTLLPNVPQTYVEVDRDKALKQGVALTDIYNTLQTFLGGSFMNYFSRFGRQWQVYVQADGAFAVMPNRSVSSMSATTITIRSRSLR